MEISWALTFSTHWWLWWLYQMPLWWKKKNKHQKYLLTSQFFLNFFKLICYTADLQTSKYTEGSGSDWKIISLEKQKSGCLLHYKVLSVQINCKKIKEHPGQRKGSELHLRLSRGPVSSVPAPPTLGWNQASLRAPPPSLPGTPRVLRPKNPSLC